MEIREFEFFRPILVRDDSSIGSPEGLLYDATPRSRTLAAHQEIIRQAPVQMQTMYAHIAGELRELTLPSVHEEVLPGIRWGAFDELMTPAYWRGQAWQHTESGTFCDFRLGRSLEEEVAACLLGGWGMPAELALAAYSRVRERNLLHAGITAQDLEDALSEPCRASNKMRAVRQSG